MLRYPFSVFHRKDHYEARQANGFSDNNGRTAKAVLMSIHPEWRELIASGRKTIEVRKTYPKAKTPFKVYIYSTLGTSAITFLWKEDGKVFTSPSADARKRGEITMKWRVSLWAVFEIGPLTNDFCLRAEKGKQEDR